MVMIHQCGQLCILACPCLPKSSQVLPHHQWDPHGTYGPSVPRSPTPYNSKGAKQTGAVWPRSKVAHPNKLTGASTSKGKPHRDWPRSSHCKPHQVPNKQCITASQSSHSIEASPPIHTIPGFPMIFPQGPTCPLVHACNIPRNTGPRRINRGVTIIYPATAPTQVQFVLGRIRLQWNRKTMPRHWNRGQRYQETAGIRNRNLPGYQIRGCTGKNTKGSNLYEGSVQGPPPEIQPQQNANHHWRQ